MKHLQRILCALYVALPAVLPVSVAAQYPDKPVRLVVPFPPGGGTDATGRLVANALSGELKQQVVVENRAGAAGSIGAQAVVDSPPDGYTLFFATTGAMAINQHLYSNLRHNPLTDFTPIAMVASFPNVLVVNPSVPAKTVAEFIALARSKPGGLTYGSSGAGSSSHLSTVLLEHMTGTKFTHVPYKGAAPATADFLGGRLDFMIDNITTHSQLVKQGKSRALGVTGVVPSPLLPGVPTIAAAGVTGYDVTIWYAILGPAKLPNDIVQKLYNALRTAMGTPKMKEALEALGTDPNIQPPAELARIIRAESDKWAAVVKASGAKAD
ncbi:MAG: tripartite tricarboxylate transporter substrate binding protein [Candidatus Parcubacteria bacterium]|nr:tripartite tricarboxylate transporter substrate binding protein [Burkholderiales bacterium]